MKKILAISLAAALLLLAGCSGAAPGEEGATALKFTDAVSLETSPRSTAKPFPSWAIWRRSPH